MDEEELERVFSLGSAERLRDAAVPAMQSLSGADTRSPSTSYSQATSTACFAFMQMGCIKQSKVSVKTILQYSGTLNRLDYSQIRFWLFISTLSTSVQASH